MKKFIVLLLTAVMSLTMLTTVFAEEGSTEITFRGIPWGTTLEDFAYNYNEFEVDVYDPHVSDCLSMPSKETEKIQCYSNGFSVENGAGFKVSVNKYGGDSVCSVAGYPVDSVSYTFILSVDPETQYPDYTTWNAKLYRGCYNFVDMNDASLMVDDLITKLTSTYGDVVDQDTTNWSNGMTEYYYMWEDENGNWIILDFENDPTDSDNVWLFYYSGNIFDWADALKTAAEKSDRDNFVASDTSEGL